MTAPKLNATAICHPHKDILNGLDIDGLDIYAMNSDGDILEPICSCINRKLLFSIVNILNITFMRLDITFQEFIPACLAIMASEPTSKQNEPKFGRISLRCQRPAVEEDTILDILDSLV